jgi:phosphatidate cytidylyltransferase
METASAMHVGEALWGNALYQQTVGIVILFLVVVSLVLFILQRKNQRFSAAWASLKSWLFAAPFLLVICGMPYPWTLVFLVLVGISAAKTFYRMTGMYHRSWFVWTTYVFMCFSGICIYLGWNELYSLMPMIFLLAISTIPFLRNSATQMIQYCALSLMAFIFFGWAFLHMGKLLTMEMGIFVTMYIYILVEFCEAVSLATTRLFGKVKLWDRITTRVSVEGIFLATFLTLILAWALRHMLPIRTEEYWVAAGITAAIFGRSGDLFLSVIRRDLGIKPSGVFIIGRDDILSRVDKLVFAAPAFYYVLLLLNELKI